MHGDLTSPTVMTHRFQVLEKIAFSLVVCSALACFGFIAYQSSPDLRQDWQRSEAFVLNGNVFPYACAAAIDDPCLGVQ
jgi:hypothetical protein